MNEDELKENLIKAYRQIDVAAEVYVYALHTAIKIVDKELPFQREIDKAILPGTRRDLILNREEAVSTIVANLLTLSEAVRI